MSKPDINTKPRRSTLGTVAFFMPLILSFATHEALAARENPVSMTEVDNAFLAKTLKPGTGIIITTNLDAPNTLTSTQPKH